MLSEPAVNLHQFLLVQTVNGPFAQRGRSNASLLISHCNRGFTLQTVRRWLCVRSCSKLFLTCRQVLLPLIVPSKPAAIAEGDRRIAIFYGSAHLPDIEDRLLTEFGLTKTNTQWRTAWRMTKRRSLPLSGIDPLEKFLTELRALSNWPLNRSQTVAMLLISLALATDLYFWELMIDFADNKLGELLPVLNLWVPMLLDKMASVRL